MAQRQTNGTISPTALAHQEGVLGLVATVGLLLRETGPLPVLSAKGWWMASIGVGVAAGFGAASVLWVCGGLGPLRDLGEWLARHLAGWRAPDAVAAALISGIAEEALFRALLQPLIGLFPAALLFAVLHVFPDRRLWIWPLVALLLGLGLGLLFQQYGYPAAAAAHVVINGVGFLRITCAAAERGDQPEEDS